MDNGPADETVTLRRDMRNPSGGLLLALCSASRRRTAAASPTWRPFRIRSSTPARSSTRHATCARIEVRTPRCSARARQMAYSRSTNRRRRQPRAGARADRGPGGEHRRSARGSAEDGRHIPLEMVDSPDLPPLWQAFGGACRPDGHWVIARAVGRGGLARRRACTSVPSSSCSRPRRSTWRAARWAPTSFRARPRTRCSWRAGKSGPFRVEAQPFGRRRRHRRGADAPARRGQRRQSHHRRVLRLSLRLARPAMRPKGR